MSRRDGSLSTRLLGLCGVAAAIAFGLADGLGIALTPGYSAASDAISELVERGAAAKGVVDPLLLLNHALVLPFAIGLRRAILPGRRWPLGPVLLGLAGLAGVILRCSSPATRDANPSSR